MKNWIGPICLAMFTWIACQSVKPVENNRKELADQMEKLLKENLVHPWYPAAIDSLFGGYLSTFNAEFRPTGDQDKMIVSQARHLWNNSKAVKQFPGDRPYGDYARHGFHFLRDKMWDKEYGGFFGLVDRQGNVKGAGDKTAYGNAFGLYGLSAYYLATGDSAGLTLAKMSFDWLEKHSHDTIQLGYYQHLNRQGDKQPRVAGTLSTSDLGYKDQNSSIHLLEAFTEFYQAWPDEKVKKRLEEMILLIRDTMVNEKGNLVLFFQPDWTPVSFVDSSRESILRHHNLDHTSFGHDIETAFLLMEASHVAGWKNDRVTWDIAKKMTDQCLVYGWDDSLGGFYDGGYYFKGEPQITITHPNKNWWTQAEALNTLLIMADLYPNDPLQYYQKFLKQWNYIDKYFIDHKNGEWYGNGLDTDPETVKGNKGHIWKAAYHQYRSMENCINRLRGKQH